MIDSSIQRSQRKLTFLVVASVTVVSFFVGIFIGFNRSEPAYATTGATQREDWKGIIPVSGSSLTEIGRGSKIGGVASEVASFTSNKSVRDFLGEQEEIWKRKGLTTKTFGSAKRGIGLAINKSSGQKYQAVVFFCPPAIRNQVCRGENIFGVTSYISGEEQAQLSESEMPRCQGMKVSGTFSSYDEGRLATTLSGVCPQGIFEAAESFREVYTNAGYQEAGVRQARLDGVESGVLLFGKEKEEVSIVLSAGKNRTFAVVSKKGS